MNLSIIHTIAYILHMLGILGILVLLLVQGSKKPRKFNVGVLHSAATALLAGLVMVGLQHPLNADNPTEWPLYNNTKIAVKLGIVLIILVLGYRQNKKSVFTTGTWATMLGLTVANIVIATAWH
jgi:energy-coupling factor transporter transmembrane protein EcfT